MKKNTKKLLDSHKQNDTFSSSYFYFLKLFLHVSPATLENGFFNIFTYNFHCFALDLWFCWKLFEWKLKMAT